jgi:molybdopterin biosynthesis enzyme
MKKIKVENAVGMLLAHDITRILPGKSKGVAFKKGHVVREEDIPALLNLGKRHLFVLRLSASQLHEDDAALRIAAAVSGPGLRWTEPSEGKSNILSLTGGLLKIDVPALSKVNRLGDVILSTLKNNFPCRKDQVVAATRIVPLTVRIRKIERLERIAGAARPLLTVRPFRRLTVGAVVTGTEIYDGSIPDEFDRYVGEKIREFGSRVVKKILAPDDPARIAAAITELRSIGSEVIVTTGGLSVDPDDVTRKGVLKAGARMVAYGSPILPGAMFLYALLDGVPILGLPACVYYHASTIFDLMLPRVLAGDTITRAEIAAMGHGGLCLNCRQCRFPVCPFGK